MRNSVIWNSDFSVIFSPDFTSMGMMFLPVLTTKSSSLSALLFVLNDVTALVEPA
ncbi:MAG TPA: hypothetical protein PLW37_01120 [bacterium]|nr:hypothetical protein [bacterium]